MQRCFSALTPSKAVGGSCSPFSTPGHTIRHGTLRTMSPAATAPPRPTSCWRAMAARGGRSSSRTERAMAAKRKISLVLADVDGTLVTEEKILTKRARDAVRALQEAGIRFAITSGRPPLGMAMLFDVLDIETPIAGFNGGLFVERDLTILEQKTVPTDVARRAVELMRKHGLDAWVYSGNDWLITNTAAPHVAREAWTVKFQPKVVADVAQHLQQVAKIVGVSDDLEKVRRCEADSQAAFGQHATA